MSWFSSCIFGIVQAITEFLPVSSSAHLEVAEHFLQEKGSVLMHLSCHLGTLIALIIYLRKELFELLFVHPKRCQLFFVALLPLPPLYFLLRPIRDILSQPSYLGFCLIGTGCIIFVGQWIAGRYREPRIPSVKDLIIIGTLQATALIPGISRSGCTISGARILGWQAKDAVRFSFLLSIPTVLGGNLFELTKAAQEKSLFSCSFIDLFLGFITSFIVGLFLVKRCISWLEKGKLFPSACYCVVLGALLVLYFHR